MSKIKLLIASLIISNACLCQNDLFVIRNAITNFKSVDTVKCHFFEVNSDTSFNWKTGFVIRSYGRIKFKDKLEIQTGPYLSITNGVIESSIFYLDMLPIKKYAISIIIL